MSEDNLLLPYRQGALAYILNSESEILLVQLNEYKDSEWNLPGGGRQANESAEDNIEREIIEELGWSTKDFEIRSKSAHTQKYDFPSDVVKSRPIGKRFRGQVKDQFLVLTRGSTVPTIKLLQEELKAYKWCKVKDLEKYLLFPGQADNAKATLKEFGYYLS